MLSEYKTWNGHPSINSKLSKKSFEHWFWTATKWNRSKPTSPLHTYDHFGMKINWIKSNCNIAPSYWSREPEHRTPNQPNLLNFFAWYWPGHHRKYQHKLIYIKKLIGAMPEVICKQSTINWTLMFLLVQAVHGIHGGHIIAIRKIKNKIVWNNLTCFRNMMVWKFHLILCCWQLCIFCCFFFVQFFAVVSQFTSLSLINSGYCVSLLNSSFLLCGMRPPSVHLKRNLNRFFCILLSRLLQHERKTEMTSNEYNPNYR